MKKAECDVLGLRWWMGLRSVGATHEPVSAHHAQIDGDASNFEF
jgi:hypothetical protein